MSSSFNLLQFLFVTKGLNMKTTYKTTGTCARLIDIEMDGQVIKNVSFIGGCKGNLEGIGRLVQGMDAEQAIAKLSGIQCRNNTSCPDQLAQALSQLILRQAS